MLVHRIKILLALFCAVSFLTALRPLLVSGQPGKPKAPHAQQTTTNQQKDYNHFTHQTHQGLVKVPNTNFARELKCDSCHERPSEKANSTGIVATTERNLKLKLKFPGHKACVECHVVQFTSRPQQTCSICHNTEQGLSARPPQRDFPPRYDFNALFDAKQHENHITYKLSDGKQLDCRFCHKPTQKALAVTIGSHPECYECHTPGSFDNKASVKNGCVICHTQMVTTRPEPFSAKLVSRAYGARFSHSEHVKYMDCTTCHSIQAGYNQYSPSSPIVKEHNTDAQKGGRGCFSCHDGKQRYGRVVFSGSDSQSCDKCHNTRGEIRVGKIPG